MFFNPLLNRLRFKLCRGIVMNVQRPTDIDHCSAQAKTYMKKHKNLQGYAGEVPPRLGAFGTKSPRHITLSEARSRLDRRRSLQVNSHFAAFFKIYKIFTILRRSNLKIFENFVKNFVILKIFSQNFKKFRKL